MTRKQILSVMILFIGLPAVAAGGSFLASSTAPCFVNGNAGYRFAKTAAADFTVKIDNGAPHPDLRMQMVSDPAAADFVLIDDAGEEPGRACAGARTIKTIRVDPAASAPDFTVALSNEPLDGQFKIYVRSATFNAQHAAALFAVTWRASARTDLAKHQ